MPIDWDKTVIGPLMGVFGQPATYQPPGGVAFNVSVVYDEAYQELAALDDGSDLTIETPVVGVQLSEFTTAPEQGGQLTITGTGEVFLVKQVRPDGRGGAKLMLNYAP